MSRWSSCRSNVRMRLRRLGRSRPRAPRACCCPATFAGRVLHKRRGRGCAAWGRLDILVNNAAFHSTRRHSRSFQTSSRDDVPDQHLPMFWLTRAALRHLAGKRDHQHGIDHRARGQSGAARLFGDQGRDPHLHQVIGADPSSNRQIRVNCVAPGPVWTPLNPCRPPGPGGRQFGEDTPMGRPAQPEEIAPAFVFFASNVDSSYVTGEVLTLLGGGPRREVQ